MADKTVRGLEQVIEPNAQTDFLDHLSHEVLVHVAYMLWTLEARGRGWQG